LFEANNKMCLKEIIYDIVDLAVFCEHGIEFSDFIKVEKKKIRKLSFLLYGTSLSFTLGTRGPRYMPTHLIHRDVIILIISGEGHRL